MLSVRPNVNFFCRRHPRANVQLHPIMQIKWLLTRLKTATRTIKRTVQIVPLKVKFDLTSCRATDTPVRRLNVMIMVWYTSVQTHLPPVLIMGLWLNLKQQLGVFSINSKKAPLLISTIRPKQLAIVHLPGRICPDGRRGSAFILFIFARNKT